MSPLEFWFDFSSGYAFFAAQRARWRWRPRRDPHWRSDA